MISYLKYIFLLFLLPLSTSFAQLQLEVSAPKEVDLDDEYFQITYTIASTSTHDFSVPSVKGLDLLAPPSMSVMSGMSYSSQNGRSSSQSYGTTTYTIVLAPLNKGSFTIPPATVRVGNATYRSKPVTIRVSGNGTARSHGRGGGKESGEADKLRPVGSRISENDLYVRAVVGRKRVYEQEAVPLSYRYYERPGVGLNTVSLNKQPDFKGMVSQDIPIQTIDASMERVNGEPYRTGVIQQYVVFPQQTGHITIPGLEFNCVVVQQEEGLSAIDAFFNGGGQMGVSLKRTAPDVAIDVLPLPLPKPANFSGGVGQFSIKGEMLTATPKTNDMVTYRITISGSGNLQLLSAPSIEFPADFDTYSPKPTDKTKVMVGGVSGEMIFDYTFVPRNVGEYTLPVVEFTYFDPSDATYKTISVPAQTLSVEKGTRTEADLERERALRNSDIHDLRKSAGGFYKPGERYLWWGTLSYWASVAAIMAVFVLLIIYMRRYERVSADVVSRRRDKAARQAARQLKHARELLKKDEKAKFRAELSRALNVYLADKLSLEAGSLSNERICQEMESRGISEEEFAPFRILLEDCEFAQFAPEGTQSADEELLGRASEAIIYLEKLMKNAEKKAKP